MLQMSLFFGSQKLVLEVKIHVVSKIHTKVLNISQKLHFTYEISTSCFREFMAYVYVPLPHSEACSHEGRYIMWPYLVIMLVRSSK